jgi:glycosyltransferase involved in cell wall biosynthesis
MIKVGLPSALIYGSSKTEAEYHIYSNLYHEEFLDEKVVIHTKSNSGEFKSHFAQIKPDVIITIGGDRADWGLITRESNQPNISFRWIHYYEEQDELTMANDIARQATYNACSTAGNPYFSVFTGCYKTDKERIYRSYQSMVNQTYQNWEWVIVDDSPDTHMETWQILNELAGKDYRVKPHRIFPVSGGNIGEVKNRAASLANGTWLIEMDHDDALVSTLMEDCINAQQQYPDAGFIYTNVAEPYEDGEMRAYTNTIGDREHWYANPSNSFVWGYGGHRYTQIDGIQYIEHVYPGINPKTIRFNIGMPNHARIWRKDVYDDIGKHNKHISVADDYELIVRTFLSTKMIHINKLLYLQYNNRNSTVDNNWKDINRKARLIKEFYDEQIHERFIELGLDDWEWIEELQRSNLYQNDMDRLQYFDKENLINYTYE